VRDLLADLLEPEPEQAGAGLLGRGLLELSRYEPDELVREFGIAPAAARRLNAAFRLGRALTLEPRTDRPCVQGPRAAYELLRPHALGLEQEAFWSLLLDGKQRLIRIVPVSVGTLTASLVHPREVFRAAVRAAAAAVVVAHNHPSGDPEPSAEDLAVTERLRRAGEVLGIPLEDHVVLGDGAFVSLRERSPFGRGRLG
jgi:DNA repair protein RadC